MSVESDLRQIYYNLDKAENILNAIRARFEGEPLDVRSAPSTTLPPSPNGIGQLILSNVEGSTRVMERLSQLAGIIYDPESGAVGSKSLSGEYLAKDRY